MSKRPALAPFRLPIGRQKRTKLIRLMLILGLLGLLTGAAFFFAPLPQTNGSLRKLGTIYIMISCILLALRAVLVGFGIMRKRRKKAEQDRRYGTNKVQ